MINDVMLSLRNVGIFYPKVKGNFWNSQDAFWPLSDISFDVHGGETLGIIGRNGAGKTTLMRVLAGIISPDRGELVNFGSRVSLISLQLGFVDILSGRENALLSGMLLGATRPQMIGRLEAIKEFSELGEKFEDQIYTYSSGMKGRLGFSVAMQMESDVILLDEILSVGDMSFRKKSGDAIKNIITSDRAVVLVSHNMESIRQMCDQAVWIENGQTLAVGEPESVIKQYTEAMTSHSGK